MITKFAIATGIITIQALEAFIFIRGLKLPPRAIPWIIIAFVVFNLPLPYVLWLWSDARQPSTMAAAVLVRPFFAWNFNWLTFLVFLGPVILIGRIAASYTGAEAIVVSMRWSILAVVGLVGAATVYGLIGSLSPPVIKRVEITVPGLSIENDGLRVAQLTDTHTAWWTSRAELERAGKIIEELNPDLVVVTGDMVDHNPDYVYAFADCLEGVRPRLGRYAIIGNHDVYTGKEAVSRRMEERGFKMLRGECVSLADKGARISLAGYDDSGKSWTSGDPAVNKVPLAIADCPPGQPVILLAHRPPRFEKIVNSRVDVVLSGHTHGGQLRLPFGGPGPADLTFPHAAGLFQSGGKSLYVSNGIGTVGWPFRLFCPADVTLITLRSEK